MQDFYTVFDKQTSGLLQQLFQSGFCERLDIAVCGSAGNGIWMEAIYPIVDFTETLSFEPDPLHVSMQVFLIPSLL